MSARGHRHQTREARKETNLNTEPVPAVLARPVLALVRKPIVRCGIDALALVRREQLVNVRNPHRAPDDLAHARHEQIAALRENAAAAAAGSAALRPRFLLHVKGLELRGEAVQEYGHAENVGHLALGGLGDVVADGVRDHGGLAGGVLDDVAVRVFGLVQDPVLVQPRDGVDVGEALERTRRRREGGVKLPDQRRGGFVLQQFVHRLADLRIQQE